MVTLPEINNYSSKEKIEFKGGQEIYLLRVIRAIQFCFLVINNFEVINHVHNDYIM